MIDKFQNSGHIAPGKKPFGVHWKRRRSNT